MQLKKYLCGLFPDSTRKWLRPPNLKAPPRHNSKPTRAHALTHIHPLTTSSTHSPPHPPTHPPTLPSTDPNPTFNFQRWRAPRTSPLVPLASTLPSEARSPASRWRTDRSTAAESVPRFSRERISWLLSSCVSGSPSRPSRIRPSPRAKRTKNSPQPEASRSRTATARELLLSARFVATRKAPTSSSASCPSRDSCARSPRLVLTCTNHSLAQLLTNKPGTSYSQLLCLNVFSN